MLFIIILPLVICKIFRIYFVNIKLEIHACSNLSPLFPTMHCVNLKYFGLYQHRTQAHFARVMLTMATQSMFFHFFGRKGIK